MFSRPTQEIHPKSGERKLFHIPVPQSASRRLKSAPLSVTLDSKYVCGVTIGKQSHRGHFESRMQNSLLPVCPGRIPPDSLDNIPSTDGSHPLAGSARYNAAFVLHPSQCVSRSISSISCIGFTYPSSNAGKLEISLRSLPSCSRE